MNRPCVRTQVTLRKVQRHPLTQNVIRTAKISFIPDVVNDVAFHHAQMNVNEILHTFQDIITLSVINLLIKGI